MNKTAMGNHDERLVRKLLESLGWTVEKARVSRGMFDLVAWRIKRRVDFWTSSSHPALERLLIQVKRNQSLSKDFFDDAVKADPIYASEQYERAWVTRWTRGPKKGWWTVWYWEGKVKSQDFRLHEST